MKTRGIDSFDIENAEKIIEIGRKAAKKNLKKIIKFTQKQIIFSLSVLVLELNLDPYDLLNYLSSDFAERNKETYLGQKRQNFLICLCDLLWLDINPQRLIRHRKENI